MPKGLIVSVWDNVSGISVKAEYPSENTKVVNEEDLLKMFSSTALTKEAGIIKLTVKQNSVIGYYGGPPIDKFEIQILVLLILSEEDNPNIMEDYLKAIAQLIIMCIERDNDLPMELVIDCFDAAKKNIEISREQMVGITFKDDLNRFILKLLGEGPINKEDLSKYLSEQLNQKITNVDKYIKPFLDLGLIFKQKIKDILGRTSEYLFLIKDVDLYRTPPIKMLIDTRKIPNFGEKYYAEMENFFLNYNPTPEDLKKLAELISNPVKYEILKMLRQEYIRYDLLTEKINMKNVYDNLTELIKNKIVVSIKEKNDFYWLFLMNDIQIVEVIPKYIIDTVHRSCLKNKIDEMVTLIYIGLLKEKLLSDKLVGLK